MAVADHCPACQVHRELTEHRDTAYPDWSPRRGLLNFALVVAARACPDYQPAAPSGSSDLDTQGTR